MALGRAIGEALTPAVPLCLFGGIGSGKSTLARALIRQASGDPALEVPSPTFTLVQVYDSPRGEIWHADLYRLDGPEEVWELGLFEAMAERITVIEWADRLGDALGSGTGAPHLDLHLSEAGDGRCAAFTAHGIEAENILAALPGGGLVSDAAARDSRGHP